jgi:amino acid adenylation domain-containing protein
MTDEATGRLVSVIIPCYNQAHFLSEAIESVLAQTYRRMEIVVVDDGSSDNTAEVAARFPGVLCIRQENRGLAEARNAGFHASRGEYIIFLDADDRLTPTAVEAHLACFRRRPEVGFVVGDIDHIAFDGSYSESPRWPLLDANHYEELLRVNHVANTIAVMFRRSVIERVGGFKQSCSPAEDYELLLQAARLFDSAHHRTVVAYYRRHSTSLSRKGALMLRAMNRVMCSQYPFVKANPMLSRALRTGEIYWREHYGAVTIKEIWRNLTGGHLRRATQSAAVLISHVRSRLFVLPWKYREWALKAVRRRLGLAKKHDGRRPSSVVGGQIAARRNGINLFPKMTETTRSEFPLWANFVRSCELFPERPAIDVGEEITYRELAQRAKRIAATIQAGLTNGGVPLTAVFAYRSATAYAGVLGALMAGHGYVPLNRTFPVDRTRLMLERSRCRSLVVDAGSEPQLERLLAGVENSLLLLCPDRTDVAELSARFPAHRIIGANDFSPAQQWRVPNVALDSIAYLLFTSGSTGQPKGVMVSHANVLHYVDYVTKRYGFTNNDRVSQTFDLTFDLSAHDMFVAWHNGACVCCPSQKQLIKPGAFINDARLTVWFSVPSTAVFMRRLGVLKPGMYPELRLSLFCGEALPVETVREWAAAAPNSMIENIYGPTELTIACTAYRWDEASSPAECYQGVVPIGAAFDDMEALIVDEDLRELEPGAAGELLMTGPQLCLGYWDDEEKTKRAFVAVPGKSGRYYYRTGDRVRRGAAGEPLLYLGRLDSQVKVLGHRVELGEVEAAVREASGLDGVVALGWPMTPSGADAIEVFLQTDHFDTKELLEKLRTRLPVYMVPRNVHLLRQFPLNANGKYDRKALQSILQSAATTSAPKLVATSC